jgi:pantetheine-phosphate adenylyltransferase
MATARKKKVVVGGTFDIFHKGHEALLRKAVGLGEVTIGLTSDILAKKVKKRNVRSFKHRKKELEAFAKKEFKVKPKIVKKENKFGPTLKENFDYIVVSPATYKTAALINQERKKRKKKSIKIVKIKFVLNKDGKPISATSLLKSIDFRNQ